MKKAKALCILLAVTFFISTATALSTPNPINDDLSQNYYDYTIFKGEITEIDFENLNVANQVNSNVFNRFQITATVQYEENVVKTSFVCDLYKFGTEIMITCNKIIGDTIEADNKILNFSICTNNDVLYPEISVDEGTALVKLAFIYDENTAISAIALLDSALIPNIDYSFLNIDENDTTLIELQNRLMLSETWVSMFSVENEECEKTQLSEPNEIAEQLFNQDPASQSNLEYYIYEPNNGLQLIEEIEEEEIGIRSTITGDTYMIVNNFFSESILKSAGCRTSTKADTSGVIFAGYHTDTYYDSALGRYYTAGAIWYFTYPVSSISGQPTQRMAEFEFRKIHNFFATYYVSQDKIVVSYPSDNSTHVITDETLISIKLSGSNNSAYFDKYYFEMCEGGSGGTTPLPISSAVTLLGKRFPVISTVSEIFGYLTDAMTLGNYIFDNSLKEYQIGQSTNKYAKQIGSTYSPLLYKKNSALNVRAKLINVTFAPNKNPKIYFQAQTWVRSCIRTGGDEHIYFYFGKNLV